MAQFSGGYVGGQGRGRPVDLSPLANAIQLRRDRQDAIQAQRLQKYGIPGMAFLAQRGDQAAQDFLRRNVPGWETYVPTYSVDEETGEPKATPDSNIPWSPSQRYNFGVDVFGFEPGQGGGEEQVEQVTEIEQPPGLPTETTGSPQPITFQGRVQPQPEADQPVEEPTPILPPVPTSSRGDAEITPGQTRRVDTGGDVRTRAEEDPALAAQLARQDEEYNNRLNATLPSDVQEAALPLVQQIADSIAAGQMPMLGEGNPFAPGGPVDTFVQQQAAARPGGAGAAVLGDEKAGFWPDAMRRLLNVELQRRGMNPVPPDTSAPAATPAQPQRQTPTLRGRPTDSGAAAPRDPWFQVGADVSAMAQPMEGAGGAAPDSAAAAEMADAIGASSPEEGSQAIGSIWEAIARTREDVERRASGMAESEIESVRSRARSNVEFIRGETNSSGVRQDVIQTPGGEIALPADSQAARTMADHVGALINKPNTPRAEAARAAIGQTFQNVGPEIRPQLAAKARTTPPMVPRGQYAKAVDAFIRSDPSGAAQFFNQANMYIDARSTEASTAYNEAMARETEARARQTEVRTDAIVEAGSEVQQRMLEAELRKAEANATMLEQQAAINPALLSVELESLLTSVGVQEVQAKLAASQIGLGWAQLNMQGYLQALNAEGALKAELNEADYKKVDYLLKVLEQESLPPEIEQDFQNQLTEILSGYSFKYDPRGAIGAIISSIGRFFAPGSVPATRGLTRTPVMTPQQRQRIQTIQQQLARTDLPDEQRRQLVSELSALTGGGQGTDEEAGMFMGTYDASNW